MPLNGRLESKSLESSNDLSVFITLIHFIHHSNYNLLIHFKMHIQALTAVASLLIAGTNAICSHNTDLYDRATAAQFTYTGLTGPLNWHSLNVNNSACAKGKYQTPINLDAGISTKSGAGFIANYPATLKTKYENLGTTVEVLGDAIGGNLTFEGTTYKLLQFHFHTPSEHRIGEEHFPLEVHFVHSSAGMRTLFF